MIVLDTNVLSEPLRPSPEPRVVAWLDAQHVDTLAVTALTIAELRYGVAALPGGRRRQVLSSRLEDEIVPLFEDRVLPFDLSASEAFGVIQARAKATGRPLPTMDALIASICVAGRHTLATRNTGDFAAAGVSLIDPWA